MPGILDDGSSQRGSARGYINNGDGTVTDNTTGLVWQRCPLESVELHVRSALRQHLLMQLEYQLAQVNSCWKNMETTNLF